MYLGIEIGGTKLQLGVSDGESASFTEFKRMNVARSAGAAGILEQIRTAAPALIERHNVKRIGIGFGGPVNMMTGTIVKSHHVSGWDGFPLADWCADELGVPAAVGNDCDVAALAEARFGAGRNRRIVFYVTVGTGIGGGLSIDGALLATHRPALTELGHLRPGLQATDPDDIVEAQASGLGIAATVRRLLATGDDADETRALLEAAGVASPEEITTKSVAKAARSGHPYAVAAFDRATRALGWAIAQAVTITAAEVIVVGGGVSLAGEDLFFEPLRERAAEYGFPPLAGTYEIVPAELGEEVVVVGGLLASSLSF